MRRVPIQTISDVGAGEAHFALGWIGRSRISAVQTDGVGQARAALNRKGPLGIRVRAQHSRRSETDARRADIAGAHNGRSHREGGARREAAGRTGCGPLNGVADEWIGGERRRIRAGRKCLLRGQEAAIDGHVGRAALTDIELHARTVVTRLP